MRTVALPREQGNGGKLQTQQRSALIFLKIPKRNRISSLCLGGRAKEAALPLRSHGLCFGRSQSGRHGGATPHQAGLVYHQHAIKRQPSLLQVWWDHLRAFSKDLNGAVGRDRAAAIRRKHIFSGGAYDNATNASPSFSLGVICSTFRSRLSTSSVN